MSRMFFGERPNLEEEANDLIRESMKGETSHSSKSDILTPWKQMDRRSREVYASSGVVDAAYRQGMFRKAASSTHTHLNSRNESFSTPSQDGSSGFFTKKALNFHGSQANRVKASKTRPISGPIDMRPKGRPGHDPTSSIRKAAFGDDA